MISKIRFSSLNHEGNNKMEIDKLTIGEAKELSKLFSSQTNHLPSAPDPYGAIRIIVAQRGWVCVGRVYLDGDEYRIEGSSIIRRWGTTKGLGEIAEGGPGDKTVLDPSGTVRIHRLAIVLSFDCNANKWSDKCR
jgi:hypothetical protein